jgi:excinuclease ABC subunit B
MSFRVEAPYKPTGDQPQAIEKLVQGLQNGYRQQTLLGATGTGKSVTYDTPVYVIEERNGERTARVRPIGPLIDSLMAAAEQVERQGDSDIIDRAAIDATFYVQAFDPTTGGVALYPVQSFTRHSPTARMYRLTTDCGRSATFTGDHNLWVLRDGTLTLIETADARPSDYIPLPELLLGSDQIAAFDLLAYAPAERVYVHAPEALSAFAAAGGATAIRSAVDASGRSGANKLYALLAHQKGHGLAAGTLRELLRSTDNLGGAWDASAARIGGKAARSGIPTQLPFSSELLSLFGAYVAEGHATKDAIIVSGISPRMASLIAAVCAQLGLRYRLQPPGDYRISSSALAGAMKQLCGSDARSKRLPEFWPDLAPDALATLLRAYFDGDGTVERASALSATTASEQLASDLAYALLRFGIWARINKVWKRATNSEHAGDWYFKVTLSGQSDLRRFRDQIGFGEPHKRAALERQIGRDENSNVDLVPIDGAQLRSLRAQLGLTARTIAEGAGMSRSGVQLIETGQRRPQRASLVALLESLAGWAGIRGASADWWADWERMRGLCNLRWTPVAELAEVAYAQPFVYDFTVPGAETFLAGQGGMFVHNTFVMAQIFEQAQRPALVLAHNKTLVSQLWAEFRDFLPDAAVEMFISYYDEYTPEAYVPSKDLYIEKEASINEEIDRLRHAATQALFTRKDVLIVASVSAIYGLGSPHDYGQVVIPIRQGEVRNRDKLLRQLIDLQFQRNDIDFHRGTFRVRGDTLDIVPANSETAVRVEFWGDEIEKITEFDPLTGEVLLARTSVDIYPAKHFVTTKEKLGVAVRGIQDELGDQLRRLEGDGKLLEAARLKQRTMYDLEMLSEVGYCSGIENYSRHMDGRDPGQTPWTLIDYFPDDFLLFIDESHITLPQIRGMSIGDRQRKTTLVDYGFRLPSALDNRPLQFEEFERHIYQVIYVSATPGPFERQQSEQIVEQIIRPTGLLDPVVEVRPTRGQVDDLIGEVRKRVKQGQRALVTTLTKRMSEDLSDYLKEMGIRTMYLHADIDTLERVEILRDLRLGVYDVVVGINLLREGLDLPEVSLVTILDADKEGYLRSETSLIQTIGRAARHLEGRVIMYADNVTASMDAAIKETQRRRDIQMAYNLRNNITPVGISKGVRDLTDRIKRMAEERGEYKADGKDAAAPALADIPRDEVHKLIKDLEKQMKQAAKDLQFEKAASLRDQVVELRKTMALDE